MKPKKGYRFRGVDWSEIPESLGWPEPDGTDDTRLYTLRTAIRSMDWSNLKANPLYIACRRFATAHARHLRKHQVFHAWEVHAAICEVEDPEVFLSWFEPNLGRMWC